jgi:PTS system nitrogen regulatory IIA component
MSAQFETLENMAGSYKMTQNALKKIVTENRIPHRKEGSVLQINVRAFDRWMAANIKKLSSEKLAEIETDEKKRTRQIHPMLHPDRVIFNPPDSTKMQVLTRLVETLGESGAVETASVKPILKAVIERERLCSTAVMDGVAIPHPRSSMEKYLKEPVLVLAISKKGIHFESDDGKPTNLFFLICANSIDVHLKAMARLSRLLRSPKFRHELIVSQDFDSVRDVFERWENKL